jgi:adenylate kinase
MIRAKYSLPITSPGAMLREEKRAGSQLGVEADKLTSHGKLVPDEMVNELVAHWLERHRDAFVFDGYPRSRGQADALDQMLSAHSVALDVVLSLEIDLPTIRDRVARRMTCSSCARIFSVGLHVPSADAKCPSCGGLLVKRKDDTSEALDARMEEFAAKTEPLISRYRERGILRSVDAGRRPEIVFDSISMILEGE